MRDFVATLRELGRSIVVCTHNLDEAERLCDRIGIMRGTLLRVDTPAGLRRNGRGATVRVQLNGARGPESFLDTMADLSFVRAAQPLDGALMLELEDPKHETPDVVNELVRAGARITGVGEVTATLEDVYLELVGEAGVRDERSPAQRGGRAMRLAFVWAVFVKECRDLLSNRLLLGAVALPGGHLRGHSDRRSLPSSRSAV